jgi:hypothetical protein
MSHHSSLGQTIQKLQDPDITINAVIAVTLMNDLELWGWFDQPFWYCSIHLTYYIF